MARRRRTDRWSGSLLDAPPGIDKHAWNTDNLLTPLKEEKEASSCSCTVSASNQLGGCKPMLRVGEDEKLTPMCGTCQKELRSGLHRRRDQLHILGLAKLGRQNIDLDDLRAAGLLFES